MDTSDAATRGIAVLDIHDGSWALWQISTNSFAGPLRATATNAVVTDGFDEKAFHSLTYSRPLLMTARARQKCTEHTVLDAPGFDPAGFLNECRSWVDLLQSMFWAENERRAAYNTQKVQQRQEARKAGTTLPGYQRQTQLGDIDWPAPPPASAWETDTDCGDPVNREALRVANGCIGLLNYWLEIEADRTRKARKYFNGIGGPAVRHWPVPAPDPANA